MRKKLVIGRAAVGVGGLMIGAAATLAHHAFAAEFDGNRPVNLRGKVTRVEWINPHAWIHIDNVDGGRQRQRRGWSRAARPTRCCAVASPRTR